MNLHDAEDPVVVENGTFSWGPDEPPVLKDINIRIPSHKLVAIVGQVGSGKSSFLSSCLGEMEKLSGKVNTKVSFLFRFSFCFVHIVP